MSKNISKNLSSKYIQKLLDHAKQSDALKTDALKTPSNRAIQRTPETIGALTGNKVADKITRVSKTSPQKISEKNKEQILRERYISRTKAEKHG